LLQVQPSGAGAGFRARAALLTVQEKSRLLAFFSTAAFCGRFFIVASLSTGMYLSKSRYPVLAGSV
jgi:hypothetical protein